jgi:hypothetical protein
MICGISQYRTRIAGGFKKPLQGAYLFISQFFLMLFFIRPLIYLAREYRKIIDTSKVKNQG